MGSNPIEGTCRETADIGEQNNELATIV